MTGVSALVTEGGHSAEQPHPFEDSEAIEYEDEASIILSATYENPNAIEHQEVIPEDLNDRPQPPSSVNGIDQDHEHEEAPLGPLNTMSEEQEQTCPPFENVFNNITRYPNKDMIMNEKVSHKNSHLVVYNTLISL